LAEIVPFPRKPARSGQLSVIFRVNVLCATCSRLDVRAISVLKAREETFTAKQLRASGLLEATFNGRKPRQGCRFCSGQRLFFGEITPPEYPAGAGQSMLDEDGPLT
jgi:hypothetical protein